MGIIQKYNSEMNKLLIAILLVAAVYASTIDDEPSFV